MRILLLGYGKMGKAIEAIALSRNHQIVARIDPQSGQALNSTIQADVAIEFTQPGSAVQNIRFCLDHHIPVVCGTTGWLNHKKELDAYCLQKDGAFFYASNYSLGVNLFFKLNQYLAQLFAGYPQYDVSIDETHHTQKKDAPSGTAITLAEDILKKLPHKSTWANEATGNPATLTIHSFRKDPFPGTHTIRYTSPVDDIEITHTAHSREGFAWGALMVAEWLIGKKGVLGMNDFLK